MRRCWAVLALVAGCTTQAPAPSSAPVTPVPAGTVQAVLDGVPLTLEVADTPAERAVGLMNRTSVPPGTGMVFRYDALSTDRYYMFQVPIPLQAVFVRAGAVVSTVVMAPCTERDPQACPTYGADGPFDTVVETAPETLPSVEPGDRFTLLDGQPPRPASPGSPSAARGGPTVPA